MANKNKWESKLRGELGEKHREAIPSYFSTIITNFQKYRYFSLPSIFIMCHSKLMLYEWNERALVILLTWSNC
jgi:hypothetical protein